MFISEVLVAKRYSRASSGVQIRDMRGVLGHGCRKWWKEVDVSTNIRKKKGTQISRKMQNNAYHAYVAPSGKMILTSASSTTAPGISVITGTPTIHLPFFLSNPAESLRGESHPKVKL